MKKRQSDYFNDHIQTNMIAQQKGFFFAIFALSILLSAILIVSFMAFVFRFGMNSNSRIKGADYSLPSIAQKFDSWDTVNWTSSFSDLMLMMGQINFESSLGWS